MRRFLLLILFSPEINNATKYEQTEYCAHIVCKHNYVKVCGVRIGGSTEIVFRVFQDDCALLKYGCQEGEMKGFRLIGMDYCKQAFNLDTPGNNKTLENNATVEDTEIEGAGVVNITIFGTTDTADTSKVPECIQCDCNSKSKSVCGIRAEGESFIIRWFADKCHMLQYNCEENVNFSVTDDYICAGDKTSFKNYENEDKTDTVELAMTTEKTDTAELLDETVKTDSLENLTCIQHNCTSNSKVICAIRLEDEQFINKWFDDECQMLQYNCRNDVNFTVTDKSNCFGDKNFTEFYTSKESTQTMESDDMTGDKEHSEITDTIVTLENIKALSEEGRNKFKEKSSLVKSSFLKNVVVSTVDITEDINKTVDNFFAASHLTGIQIQKLDDEESRRMIIKDTGPINIFVPRAFVPANYTPVELRNESKTYPEYSPLVKYCYHKCPEKCPEFYRPVCGARIDKTKQTPFVFFRNHCYMDRAKCMIKWAGYKDKDYTELEEMGFVFCGGYKLMNTMYMFPLVRILQKMGRLKKKGKIRFLMRDLGRYSVPLQG